MPVSDIIKQWVQPFKQQWSSLCLLGLALGVGWLSIPILEPLVEDWATLTFAKPVQAEDTALLSGTKAAEPLSIIVLVDDESIKKLEKQYGAYPWQGKSYQKILSALEQWYQPSAISLTQSFSQKTREALILNASGRVTQSLTPWQVEELADDVFESPLSIGEISQNTNNNTIRTIKLLWDFHNSHLSEKRLPSLALSTALKHFDDPTIESASTYFTEGGMANTNQATGIKLRAGKKEKRETTATIKTTPEFGFQPIWYPVLGKTPQGYVFTHTTLPLWRLLQKKDTTLLEKTKGVPLLFGYTNSLNADKVNTPLSNQHLLADVQATVVDNIIQGNALTTAAPWQQWAIFTTGFLLLLILKLLDKTTWQSSLIAFGLISGYSVFCAGSLTSFHLVFNWLLPLYGMVAGFSLGEWCRQFQRERALVMMESNLAQLVSPTVLKEIVRRKEKLEAGGRRIIITSMFVDIRDFTKISEGLAPSEVTDMLNAWYTQVERIVTEYRGTVDKYLGDGALIMFGAPMETNQHADMAIRAARHLVTASTEFAESWNKKSSIPFSIGISINSGAAFVGFVGPSEKLEYTAIGDTVNTSSRLQDHAKAFKTVLIFSETTLRTCTNMNMNVPVVPLGEITIRGKETLVNVFTFADMFFTPIEAPVKQKIGIPQVADSLTTVSESTGFVFEGSFQQQSSSTAPPLTNVVLTTPFPTSLSVEGATTLSSEVLSSSPLVMPFTPMPTQDTHPTTPTSSFLLLPPSSFGANTKEASPFMKPLSTSETKAKPSNPFAPKKSPFHF
jgi:class 3 adenylate cyclase